MVINVLKRNLKYRESADLKKQSLHTKTPVLHDMNNTIKIHAFITSPTSPHVDVRF